MNSLNSIDYYRREPQVKEIWQCQSLGKKYVYLIVYSDEKEKVNKIRLFVKHNAPSEPSRPNGTNGPNGSIMFVGDVELFRYETSKNIGKFAEFKGINAELTFGIDNKTMHLNFHGDQPTLWLDVDVKHCDSMDDFLSLIFPNRNEH